MERKTLYTALLGIGILGAIASAVYGTFNDFQGAMVSFIACIGLVIISVYERRKD